MLAALLVALGVDLIVIVVLLALSFSRKRWVKRQPGAFSGAIRVADGEIDGLRPKWSRGYGRWVTTSSSGRRRRCWSATRSSLPTDSTSDASPTTTRSNGSVITLSSSGSGWEAQRRTSRLARRIASWSSAHTGGEVSEATPARTDSPAAVK